jgi:hypothetical protein
MGLEIRIIINDRFTGNRRSHKYRATPEEIEQNRKEIAIQNERDKRAREKALSEYENQRPRINNSPLS